jgi:hypothetical protein
VPRFALLLISLCFIGCASTPQNSVLPGIQRCESFFIYILCITDLNQDGSVDFMYFDDTREIFMYEDSMRNAVATVMPFHACAIPMSGEAREYSSQLLYSEGLTLSQKLTLKGKMLTSYRKAQQAVDACYRSSDLTAPTDYAPFDIDDGWDQEGL